MSRKDSLNTAALLGRNRSWDRARRRRTGLPPYAPPVLRFLGGAHASKELLFRLACTLPRVRLAKPAQSTQVGELVHGQGGHYRFFFLLLAIASAAAPIPRAPITTRGLMPLDGGGGGAATGGM